MRRSIVFTTVLFVLLLLLPLCDLVAQAEENLFTDVRIVDSVGDDGTQSSIAIDSKGSPHISYTYSTSSETHLMYARWTGSEFLVQTVDGIGGDNPSIALDAFDNPHICYTRSSINETFLIYTSQVNLEWVTQIIQIEKNGSLSDPSLKMDSRDIPHSGFVGSGNTLQYTVWTGSSWNTETIDPWTQQVSDPSLALDSFRKPCISYHDLTAGLKCARWTGSGWNQMVVDSAPGLGRESSIAMDSSDNPHISYDDNPNGNLKYASWNGSSWDIQIVDRNKRASFHSSLALDSDGSPHISYEDIANGNLVYARWTGAIWNRQIVDQVRSAPGDLEIAWGYSTSLALSADGIAHISYCGYTRQDLKYASISDSPSFLVTFNLNGAVDFEGKVLEVDSIDLKLPDLPKSFLWRSGSSHSYDFISSLNSNSEVEFVWVSTSGLSILQSDILKVTQEGTISANYEVASSEPKISISQLNYIIGSAGAAAAITVLAVFFMRRKKSK